MSGTFPLQSLHGYDVESPYRYFTFYGEKEQKTTIILCFWTWILFFGIKFQKKYANILHTGHAKIYSD